MPDTAPTTIAGILRSPLGARYLGDDYPRWRQGRDERPSKTIAVAEHEADLLAKALRRDGSDEGHRWQEAPRRRAASRASLAVGHMGDRPSGRGHIMIELVAKAEEWAQATADRLRPYTPTIASGGEAARSGRRLAAPHLRR